MMRILVTAAILSLAACGNPTAPTGTVQNSAAVENVAPAENLAQAGNVATPAPAEAVAAAKPPALDPLQDGDETSLEPGCFCSFIASKHQTLLTVAASKAIIRIDGERKICEIRDEQSREFLGDGAEFTCDGYRISVKGRGEIERGAEETSGRGGTLTISRGGQSKTYEGEIGCQC